MRYLIVFLLALGLPSCAPANREQLTKEVVSQDPEFAAVIEKHRQLISRIQTYEKELALKRSTVDKTITQLRKDLAGAAATVRLKTAETKKRMDPDRERLTLALSAAGEELRAMRQQRAQLGRQIAQLKKAAKTAKSAWSRADMNRHDQQIRDMLRDAQRLDQEMAGLKEHTRLLKLKLLLIKL
jgi:hypothetical protein